MIIFRPRIDENFQLDPMADRHGSCRRTGIAENFQLDPFSDSHENFQLDPLLSDRS